jgi:ATP phosphoribosyltransferase
MRMAMPKGRLLDGVSDRLRRAGVTLTFLNERDYRPKASGAALDVKLVKARVVPQLVALGQFQVGFAGLDLVREADYEQVVAVADLGLNPVRIVVAVPQDRVGLLDAPPRRPVVIATEYERIADRWALARNLAHIVIQTYGSTEAYAPEDADIVIDCVETGTTMAANGLVIIEELFRSTTHLVANRAALEDDSTRPSIEALTHRLATEQEARP